MIWVFIIAHVYDDVRNGRENLFIVFAMPPVVVIAAIALGFGRIFWRLYPGLVPHRTDAVPTRRAIVLAHLIAPALILIWCNSPLLNYAGESGKLLTLIVLGGAALASTYQGGGRRAVLASLLYAEIVAAAAFAISWLPTLYLSLDNSTSGNSLTREPDLMAVTVFFLSLSAPYAIAVALYDGYRQTVRDNLQ